MRIYETDEPCKIHIACLQAMRSSDGGLAALVTKSITYETIKAVADLVELGYGINAICLQCKCGRDLVDKVREVVNVPRNEPKWTYFINGEVFHFQDEIKAKLGVSSHVLTKRLASDKFPEWYRMPTKGVENGRSKQGIGASGDRADTA